MHELVRAFSSRTQRAKKKISQPPTPSSDSEFDAQSGISGGDDPPPGPRTIRSFLPSESRASDALSHENPDHFVGVWHCKVKMPRWIKKLHFPATLEPHSKIYVSWLFLVTLAFMYNAIVIPLRGVFPYQTDSNVRYWMCADYFCDVIYVLDIFFFKSRLRFINNGVGECDQKEVRKNYTRKLSFKIQSYWEFYERCDQASRSFGHAIRIIKTMTYMLFLIHIETCGYYAVSSYQGIASNRWVYQGDGIAYIRCFYLATKTATSIGNNPKPTNTLEYIFMTIYWLSGVFVFALLIGQIRDIVEAAGMVKDTYRKKMDSCLWYMQSINLPEEMKDKVREWFLYNWEQQKTIDERSLVSALPRKLQTDLAINVHFNTLSKVQLFQDCERNLLYDLVLKLRPILYLPGDYICQKVQNELNVQSAL
ncbi:cyclic nucleotide-gated cation channel beta-1 [Elysia marginata]|uniref:Cyclic nucleotide-gated cation channel beta-1 n=1 Tax=Elysia marginata TaxID=1093978 RepID=A0AAV4I874_9GAST|nr:cyclic nucleotide-gated cation channel beta-1 [Elysia marginata]